MKFSLGQIVSTPGALEFRDELLALLSRHVSGDWGDICVEDKELNDEAVTNGSRIFSSYEVRGGKVWIITEADRSVTTFLLPEEY